MSEDVTPTMIPPTLEYNLNDDTHLSTALDYIRWSTSVLINSDVYYGHGTDNPFDEARALVLAALSMPFESSELMLGAKLTEQERAQVKAWLYRRVVDRVPLAYLMRAMRFAELDFYIDERVLVPRSPFAELIMEHFAPWWPEGDQPNAILDLCCGSGCIGIAAGIQMQSDVVLADISADALEVADINAKRYEEAVYTELVQSDLFAQIEGQFDLIVTNPPYVDADEMRALPPEYHHEPALGLASGEDGLLHIREILKSAPHYLTERGILFAEVGASEWQMQLAMPDLPVTWIDFAEGGSGVFVITREALVEYWQSH